MSTVDDLAHEFLRRNSELDPTAATSRGTLGHDRDLTDYSPDGEAARADLARSTLARLQGLAPESESDRLALAVMCDRLQVEVDVYDSGEWLRDLSVFGPMTGTCR
ncbi:MAG: DUF885 family protein, partial [Candidatus Dormibacteria bacterium]